MGRAPCCDKEKVKRGPWSPEEDSKLKDFIEKNGTGGNWIALPQKAGLMRCGKSCRLRWLNYLRPNIKHGQFSDEEDRIICSLFANIGSRWSIIAGQLPGRTDNDIKNYWNTKLKKKLMASLLLQQNHQHKKFQYYPQQSQLPPQLPLQPNDHHMISNTTFSFNPSSTLPAVNTFSISLPQESMYGGNMMQCLPPLKDHNALMLGGGEQASCSSSDGSCSQQVNLWKEIKQEGDVLLHQTGDDHNTMVTGGHHYGYNGGCGDDQMGKGYFGNNIDVGNVNAHPLGSLEYDLEEVKQLIVSDHHDDVGKTDQDRALYLYNNYYSSY